MGVGIILTALILSIGNPSEKLTDEEIIIKATALGMTMKDDVKDNLEQIINEIKPSGNLTPPVTPKQEITPAVSPEASLTDTPTLQPVEEVSPTQQPEDTPTPTEAIPEESEDEIKKVEITFQIEKGMSSGQVAKILEKKGLVEDSDDFNTYIMKQGKASVIKTGSFTLPKGSTYKEILDTIIKQVH